MIYTIIYLLIFILVAGALALYFLTIKKRGKPILGRMEKRWKKNQPTDMDFVRYSLFLIGDCGAPSLMLPDNNLDLLQRKLSESGKNSGLFFLGDNIYPTGMPRPGDPMHEVSEKRLLRQIRAIENFEGKTWFISGNHDWNKGKEDGYEYVRRQQFYIEAYFQREDIFLPRNGCPGPVELNINEHLTIIVINTQWWVQDGYKPIGDAKCKTSSEHEFFTSLEKCLDKNKDKRIVVIGHHPVYSHSHHGGSFSLKHHLFPLTALHKNLYVPLPIAGSLYPTYRKYIGSKEDMSHPKYKNMRNRLVGIFSKHSDLIYASGHDHNLQYIKKNEQHYLISGAGSKVSHVQKKKSSIFSHAHKGFMKLDFYFGGEVWLEVWEPNEEGEANLAFRKLIIEKKI